MENQKLLLFIEIPIKLMRLKMQTSNFANNSSHNLHGISISRFPPQFFNGREYPPFMPSRDLLNAYKTGQINWDEYAMLYQCLNLQCLHPQKTFDALHSIAPKVPGKFEVILLCHEGAKTLDEKPCHRRLVAQWFETELGVLVPEWRKGN